MSTDKYQRLRDALAAGPTPGPWRIGTPPPNGEQTIGTRQGLMLAVATTGMEAETLANATYIAAADPDTIAALIAERDRLREALHQYANPLNWSCDEQGIRRCWEEFNSSTPRAYNGFEFARAALAMGDTDAR